MLLRGMSHPRFIQASAAVPHPGREDRIPRHPGVVCRSASRIIARAFRRSSTLGHPSEQRAGVVPASPDRPDMAIVVDAALARGGPGNVTGGVLAEEGVLFGLCHGGAFLGILSDAIPWGHPWSGCVRHPHVVLLIVRDRVASG